MLSSDTNPLLALTKPSATVIFNYLPVCRVSVILWTLSTGAWGSLVQQLCSYTTCYRTILRAIARIQQHHFQHRIGLQCAQATQMEEDAAHIRWAAVANAFAALLNFSHSCNSWRPHSFEVPTLEPAALALPQPRMISKPWVGTPEKYDRILELCRQFWPSCFLVFSLQPYTNTTEEVRAKE